MAKNRRKHLAQIKMTKEQVRISMEAKLRSSRIPSKSKYTRKRKYKGF